MAPVLLDTNILVYLFDSNSPAKQQQAKRVVDHILRTKIGCISAQNLAEFLQVSTHKLSPPLSWTEAFIQAEYFSRMFPIYELTLMVILEAARGARDYGLAYYDAQIWASARLNQVTVIFSEDFSDGQALEGVRFVNPFAAGFRLEQWA